MKFYLAIFQLILALAISAIFGCSTVEPKMALLRPAADGAGFELKIVATHRNVPNIHTFELDTYSEDALIIFDSISKEIDGSNVKIIYKGGTLQPRGKIYLAADQVTIKLQTGFKDSVNNSVKFSDFNLNGTYALGQE